MPWAYDPAAVDPALAQRTAAMQVGIIDCEELAVGVEQRNRSAAGFNHFPAAFRDISMPRGLYELCQLVGSSRGVFCVDLDVVVA